MKKIGLLFSLFFVASLAAPMGMREMKEAKADGLGLVYKLDFEDSSNLGKNTAGSLDDATVHVTDNHVRQIARGDQHAVYLDGTTSFENYLSLPTTMFQNVDNCTIAGWFYHPTGAGDYQGELGIYSPENDKCIRSDQYAPHFSNCYLFVFGNDQHFNSKVFPVYDAWYHMAYTFNNGDISIYQNGKLVSSFHSNTLPSVSVLHSTTSHFYLGQSAYETNHPDYLGGFDDIRVYQTALSRNDIVTEYNLKNTDFLVDEYTFDSQADLLKDNVRGYTISTHDADTTAAATTNDPQFVDGAMLLDRSTAVLSKVSPSFGDAVNPNYLFGLSECTFSVDLKVDPTSPFDWVRIFDIFAADGQRLTYMSHTGGSTSSMNIVYNGQWIISDEAHAYNIKPGLWHNLVVVMTVNSMSMYANGVEVVKATVSQSLNETIWNFVSSNNSWFTMGAPVYEGNRYIKAYFDNFRVYATSLNADEVTDIANHSRAMRTVTIDGVPQVVPDYEDFELEPKSQSGYSFLGYKDQNNNMYTDVLPAGTGDIVLTSVFEAIIGTITFNGSGAQGTMDPVEVTSLPFTLPENQFVKAGYEFKGWATTAGGEVVYQDQASITSLSGNLTLYAVFQGRAYTVSYDANGGTGQMAGQQFRVGEGGKLSKNTFTREGYNFSGWASTPTGIKEFDDEYQFADTFKGGNDVTLYASWVLKSITITFNANGGTGTMNGINADALSLVQLPACSFVKEGYTFAGWATSSDGAVVYENQGIVSLADDAVLYAVWTVNTVTITFNANGGNGTMQSVSGNAGSAIKLPKCTFEKEGYTFKGWALSENGEVVYQDEANVETLKDIELFAIYEKAAPTPSKKGGMSTTGMIILFSCIGAAVVAGAVVAIVVLKNKKARANGSKSS